MFPAFRYFEYVVAVCCRGVDGRQRERVRASFTKSSCCLRKDH